MAKKTKKADSLPPMRPRAGTIAEFPAPPPEGSRLPSKPPQTALPLPPEDESEPTPLVTKKEGEAPKRRRDPLDVVREAIGELEYLDSPQMAAGVCSAALQLGLGARAVIIHAHDARAKEIRIYAANGPRSAELVGKKALVEDDVVASVVVDSARPMTLVIDSDVGLPKRAPERLKAVGAERAVVAVPAVVKGRVVAIIEVIDAHEGTTTAIEPAAEYAGRQLAQYMIARKRAET